MKNTRGFTLFEALVTMLLIFLVLGIACDLVREYSDVLRFSAAKTDSLTSMQVALQEMIDDARQATSLESPLAGESAADLRFQMMDSAAPWLPQPIPTPLPSTWDPLTSTPYLEIHYYLLNGNLMRDAGRVSAVPVTTQVAGSVAGLSVTSLSTSFNALLIQLSLQESQRILVITGQSQGPTL